MPQRGLHDRVGGRLVLGVPDRELAEGDPGVAALLVRHLGERGEDFLLGVPGRAVPGTQRPQHVLGHEDPGAGQPQVPHPRGPHVIEGVEPLLVAVEVGAAEVLEARQGAPQALRAGVRYPHHVEAVQAGRLAALFVDQVREVRRRVLLGERHGPSQVGAGALVEGVHNPPRTVDHLVVFQQPHVHVPVDQQRRPEGDLDQLAPPDDRHGPVGVHGCEECPVRVDVLVDDGPEVDVAECGVGFGGVEQHGGEAVLDELLQPGHDCGVFVVELRRLAEEQVRRGGGEVGRQGHVEAAVALPDRGGCAPQPAGHHADQAAGPLAGAGLGPGRGAVGVHLAELVRAPAVPSIPVAVGVVGGGELRRRPGAIGRDRHRASFVMLRGRGLPSPGGATAPRGS
ncbi:hypothetical protein GA0074692_6875 [Micromonospora pallida]|uniref:Uncharacterized protein n=1 Tax=Micromonospora pallida TaxID=145854 RepID=A0A1C6TPD7_9ACTN|nr:hypothetical protein GA0074692_6875 [Micromonospora pallida]